MLFRSNPATAGAGQIARVQWLQLKNHGKLGRLAQFVFDDVAGDFRRQREWKSHKTNEPVRLALESPSPGQPNLSGFAARPVEHRANREKARRRPESGNQSVKRCATR